MGRGVVAVEEAPGASGPVGRSRSAGAFGLEVDAADLNAVASYIREKRGADPDFDIIRFGQTKDPADTATVQACAEAGATWWVEYIFTAKSSVQETRARLHQGPPRISGARR